MRKALFETSFLVVRLRVIVSHAAMASLCSQDSLVLLSLVAATDAAHAFAQ